MAMNRLIQRKPAASAPAAVAAVPAGLWQSDIPAAQGAEPQTALLTPADVADRWSVTEASLERWRANGEGPKFVRLSRKTIRYREGDVKEFIKGRVAASTAAR